MSSLRDIDESALVLACDMFVQGSKTPEIRDAVNRELARLNRNKKITREQVYQLLTLGRERRFFTFTPPAHHALQTRVANAFDVAPNRVQVANSISIDHLAATAATLLVELILDLGNKNEDVHVGLGGGYTTRLVAYHLATQLRAIPDLPKLTLHALSTGFNPMGPHTAPVAFFGFFQDISPAVEYVGLFAPPVVDTADYVRTIRRPGVKESFDAREQLDLVVTSLGSASHGHGDFFRFMELGTKGAKGAKSGLKVLQKAGWIGDVQYRPYSETGPILDDTTTRAVTLLELDELSQMAASGDKYVVVVAGPCGECGQLRTDAVMPLLVAPKLRLWSHFAMDMATAEDLVAQFDPDGGPGTVDARR
jgi:DNA-binding transcriptional regulator LsrR (DeoR family)